MLGKKLRQFLQMHILIFSTFIFCSCTCRGCYNHGCLGQASCGSGHAECPYLNSPFVNTASHQPPRVDFTGLFPRRAHEEQLADGSFADFSRRWRRTNSLESSDTSSSDGEDLSSSAVRGTPPPPPFSFFGPALSPGAFETLRQLDSDTSNFSEANRETDLDFNTDTEEEEEENEEDREMLATPEFNFFGDPAHANDDNHDEVNVITDSPLAMLAFLAGQIEPMH